MSTISDLRQKKLSLFHEINTVILPDLGYIEDVSEDTLVESETISNQYSFSYSNIAYADPSGRINPSGVQIFDNDRQLDVSEYTVNYVDSTVQLNATPSGSITADYQFYTINLLDAFPEGDVFEATDLPMMSIDFAESYDEDYAIGQQMSFWISDFFIDIFASNDGMRMDLMDRMQKGLRKWIPQLRFTEHPIKYDGTINEDFIWEDQFVRWIKLNRKTSGSLINSGTFSDKERFRAVVRGSFKTIN
jgi:hypothetical protein